MIVGLSAIFLKTHPFLASHGLEWFLNNMLLRIMCSSFISFKIILLYASLNLTMRHPSLSQTPRFCLLYICCDCKHYFIMKLNWFKYNQKPSNEDLLNILKRIERAYNLVELNKQEQIIFEKDRQQQLFDVQSIKNKSKSYEVNPDIKTCTCPDFNFRLLKCKHIIAVELVSLLSSSPQTGPQSLSVSPAPSSSSSSVIAA
jgi:hypothetical protein